MTETNIPEGSKEHEWILKNKRISNKNFGEAKK